MARFCTRCGNDVLDDSIYCDHCGSLLRARSGSPGRAEAESYLAQVQAKQQSSESRRAATVRQEQPDSTQPATAARPAVGVRWLVVGCAALVLVAGLLHYGHGARLFITDFVWVFCALAALVPITISIYGRPRHQLAASSFLVVIAIEACQELSAWSTSPGGISSVPAFWLIAVSSILGALVAFVIGVSAKRH
jgi:hypothetical protein